MSFFPIIIVAMVFGTVITIIKMGLEHSRHKSLTRQDMTDNSMRASELELLISSAVSAAVEPLMERIDDLESDRLLSTSGKMLIGNTDLDDRTESSRTTETKPDSTLNHPKSHA